VNSISVYEDKKKKTTLIGFLDEIALANQELESDKEKQLKRNSVVLMTMHSAKGLEFPRVYLVGLVEGILPHQRSIQEATGGADQVEEERRLCYVGVTRAEDNLTLSLALSRRKWGKPRPSNASRFLFEMTGQAEKFVPNRPDNSAKSRLAAARGKANAKRKAISNAKKSAKPTTKSAKKPTRKKSPRRTPPT
jgi:DNA helicase-2/ATP-dependent DNA helicase PcrA